MVSSPVQSNWEIFSIGWEKGKYRILFTLKINLKYFWGFVLDNIFMLLSLFSFAKVNVNRATIKNFKLKTYYFHLKLFFYVLASYPSVWSMLSLSYLKHFELVELNWFV